MRFDKSELQQLTPEYIADLPIERRAELFEQLRVDLMEAQDRLNQDPSNSSRPPSSRPPWERSSDKAVDTADDTDKQASKEDEAATAEDTPQSSENTAGANRAKPKRKPGKQRGAKGFGRTQKLVITDEVIHRPEYCAGCGSELGPNLSFEAKGGYYTIDLKLSEPGYIGLQATNTKHIYGSVRCSCGFETTTTPKRIIREADWTVALGENRLVGPLLLAFIVFLKIRMHLTVSKTRELLSLWLGIDVSDGCINTVIREGGRATSCLEPELIDALKTAGLLHVDETGWKEHKVTRWFWAAIGANIAYYTVGPRSSETAQKILEGFQGWIMTDGYCAYRQFTNRLRCWAHLERKATALEESWDKDAASFGTYAVRTFESLRGSVYEMREQPPSEQTSERAKCDEIRLGFLLQCLKRNDSRHEATRKFAVEILNDHEAIFRVLKNPHLPLSNNLAERSLRCWVILRNMCHGSKTEEGSKTVSIFASVVDTLRMRKVDPWGFLAQLFQARRSGRAPPPLPAPT